tara:strand:+ start:168 stop:320 length:153 start_codon:yes stop_codon:yes gene_type:complete
MVSLHKLVEHHGKSGCDGNSNSLVIALKEAMLPPWLHDPAGSSAQWHWQL